MNLNRQCLQLNEFLRYAYDYTCSIMQIIRVFHVEVAKIRL